jgi:hypothetical protein
MNLNQFSGSDMLQKPGAGFKKGVSTLCDPGTFQITSNELVNSLSLLGYTYHNHMLV